MKVLVLYIFFFFQNRFDIAGAGACLKRYTDPSFFKAESASSRIVKSEVHREKKIRKGKVLLWNYHIMSIVYMLFSMVLETHGLLLG